MSARVTGWRETDREPLLARHTPDDLPRFLTVHDLSRYLHINEKKVYSLASDGLLPATKITGKWLFPRELVDQWLLQSTHGGVMTDRLLLAGAGDPLLRNAVAATAAEMGGHALLSYGPTHARHGLELLARGRIDACALNWGPAEESRHRHAALLERYSQHRPWLLLRLFQREQGILLGPDLVGEFGNVADLFAAGLRWVSRPEGSGSQRFFQESLARQDCDGASLTVALHAATASEAAAALSTRRADAAPGSRSLASEYGLGFVSTGWESFDLAMNKDIYFRTLFQSLLDGLRAEPVRQAASHLGGYDFEELGNLVWSE